MPKSRVEKAIRMRVRIICHYCRTNYFVSKECTSCHHRRCEKCTRLPPKNKNNKNKNKEGQPQRAVPGGPSVLAVAGSRVLREAPVDAAALSADEGGDEAEMPLLLAKAIPKRPKRKQEVPLVKPSRTGAQDLSGREPVQRVHRICCKCQRRFIRDSNGCSHCRHFRCSKCPRVPSKIEQRPSGHLGDIIPEEPEPKARQWKKPRVRVRWTCHECRKPFMEGEYRCADCSHARCSDCERDPPRRARVQGKPAAVGAPSTEADVANAPGIPASASRQQSEKENFLTSSL